MIDLSVQIEIGGSFVEVGSITGTSYQDAVFSYSYEYLDNPHRQPISLALPLERINFDARSTKIFFDGLLPEGFTRESVAKAIKADSNDYITILSELGGECLGAIKIFNSLNRKVRPNYKPLSVSAIKALAKEGATNAASLVVESHLSLTGASGKVGLYYDEKTGRWFLPAGEAPSTYIVKQSHIRYADIVINEQLCLLTAKKLGINVPESFIIETDPDLNDGDVLFATRRYDRTIDKNSRTIKGLPVPYRLHQEDFSQALGIPANQKYEESGGEYLKKMIEILRSFSANPIDDQMALWKICVFNYLVGNTDNHLKNLSLLYSKDLSSVRLAPAYDIISIKIYNNSSKDMSLGINGKYRITKITRDDFKLEAKHSGLGSKLAMSVFDYLKEQFVPALMVSAEELAGQGFKQAPVLAEKIAKAY